MKRSFRSFAAPLALVLALLAGPAPAQQGLPAPQAVVAVPDPGLARPALWKVADADTTIYLFGTIHLLPKGVQWFDGKLASAFAEAGELVTEIPEVVQSEQQAVVMKRAMLPKGQQLRAMLTLKERTKYDATMKQFGLPVTAFDRYKPWYAAVVLATMPLQLKGYDLESGAEATLAEHNKAKGHPRIGLETLDYQLSLFDAFPRKVQKTYLFEVIEALPSLDKDVGEMVSAWQRGDAAKLADLMNAEEDDPAMIEALLINRNKAWARWIRTRLDRPGTVFVAVGAGHLGGKGSVQDQLAKAGVQSARLQ
ncbi:TraB/GumN family protein [Novosphingobium sp. B 225]|uniref:TraB/GumN family protein n=1 Tax=Novosphingobium sp. B 225 TaxID=1961849 RepID=UPI001124E002|nr:TraB/GumN family protein [Novosphingobium sp. B 225]